MRGLSFYCVQLSHQLHNAVSNPYFLVHCVGYEEVRWPKPPSSEVSPSPVPQLCELTVSVTCLYLLSSSRSGISPKHQSVRMSKITNDGLTESDTGCFIAVPIWQRWASKG